MKILCITGTRADYGIYKPVLFELEKDPDFHLQLVVTGMHLCPEYGHTLHEIKKDSFPIIATPSILFKGDSTLAMSQSVGMGILYFADIFQQHNPSIILLLGDRGEMLAAAIAAHYQNIGIIHLHGGEISGSADDGIRHCISKLAHLHFVSTYEAKNNLLKMGEEEWRIHPIGSLRKHDIKRIKQLPREKREQLLKKYHLKKEEKKILFVFHPDTKETVPIENQINEVLTGLKKATKNSKIIIIGSNSDAGGDLFQKKLIAFANQSPHHVSYYSSIPSDEYLFLLSQVNILVGNSSSGIIEAPFFQLPFIHIGNRQKLRTHAENVLFIDYHASQIEETIHNLLSQYTDKTINNPYDLYESPAKEMLSRLKESIKHPHFLHKKTILPMGEKS
jgi:GDP/UDP-N,N'-diacetylbacillosamine 2-epimerase (hydrolysing)